MCIVIDNGTLDAFQQRLDGFRATLAGSSSPEAQIKRLGGEKGWTEPTMCPIDPKGNIELAYNIVSDVLAKSPDIGALVMLGSLLQSEPNAYTALVEKFRDKIDSGALAFVGAGVDPKQVSLVKAGYSSGQVGDKPFEIGYTATMTLYSAIHGKTPAPQAEADLDICTRKSDKTCQQLISCPDHEIVCTDNTCRPSCN